MLYYTVNGVVTGKLCPSDVLERMWGDRVEFTRVDGGGE